MSSLSSDRSFCMTNSVHRHPVSEWSVYEQRFFEGFTCSLTFRKISLERMSRFSGSLKGQEGREAKEMSTDTPSISMVIIGTKLNFHSINTKKRQGNCFQFCNAAIVREKCVERREKILFIHFAWNDAQSTHIRFHTSIQINIRRNRRYTQSKGSIGHNPRICLVHCKLIQFLN